MLYKVLAYTYCSVRMWLLYTLSVLIPTLTLPYYILVISQAMYIYNTVYFFDVWLQWDITIAMIKLITAR